MNLFMKQKQTHIEKKLTVTKEEMVGDGYIRCMGYIK